MSDSSQSQPPGWYYAQGDPPNTQRYWDGAAWQGGPQPIPGAGQAAAGGTPGAAMGDPSVGGAGVGGVPAEAGQRFIAYLIDAGIIVVGYIVLVILAFIGGALADALAAIIIIVGYLGLLGFIIYNHVIMQGNTGQTFGKKQQNIKLLSSQTGQPVGAGQAVLRWLFQGLLGAVCGIPLLVDHIFVLSKPDHKRFSDDMLKMHVYKA